MKKNKQSVKTSENNFRLIRSGKKNVIVFKITIEYLANDFILFNEDASEAICVTDSETTYKTVSEITEEDLEGTNYDNLQDLMANLRRATELRNADNVLNTDDRVAITKIHRFIGAEVSAKKPDGTITVSWSNPNTWFGGNDLPTIG